MAEAPDEPLIDPSPPPEEKRRNWRVRRLVFYGFLGGWAMVALWNLFKPMPDGTRIRGEVVDTPLEQLEFLSDVSGADVFGAPVVRQQIFDAMLATIREARQYIVVDVFLFNGQRGSLVDTPPPRALSAEGKSARSRSFRATIFTAASEHMCGCLLADFAGYLTLPTLRSIHPD